VVSTLASSIHNSELSEIFIIFISTGSSAKGELKVKSIFLSSITSTDVISKVIFSLVISVKVLAAVFQLAANM
jgi:hypothetical protein